MPALADREQYEAAIVAELAPIFEAQFRRALDAAAPLAGPHATRQHAPSIPWSQFRNELTRAMTRELSTVFQAAGAALPIGGLGLGRDETTILLTEGMFSTRADQWAANMAREISSHVVETSQRMANQAWQLSGGDKVKFGEAMALVFMADARLEGIAVTECTRAVSAGERAIVLMLPRLDDDHPEKLVPVWHVEVVDGRPDKRVCPICLPLNGHGPLVYERVSPGGPPRHVRCRCHLEYVTAEQFARGITTGRRAA